MTNKFPSRRLWFALSRPRSLYGPLLALLLPLFALLPLLTHAGLPNTADGPAHLMRQVELNRAWQEGNFYPRWGTDLALGHGMPIFSYAPPALYHLTQLFHLAGLPLDEAMKGVLVLDFLLYSLGMFLLARRLFGPTPALLAAALYVYAPYRLREAYIQGNYGQFTGLACYPLILWAFTGLVVDGRPRYLLLAALSLAGLLFSHNISFMLFAPLLAAYVLFLLFFTPGADQRSSESANQHRSFAHSLIRSFADSPLPLRLGRVAAAGLLGLGLAAIFWLPAFGERHAIKLEGITRGFFDFRANFIRLAEFISPPLPLDRAAINPEFPLSLGLAQVIGSGIGLVAVVIMLLTLMRKLGRWKSGRPEDRRSRGVEKEISFQPSDLPTFQPPTSNLQPPPLQPSDLQPPTPTLQPPSSIPPTLQSSLFFTVFLLLYAFLALPQSRPLWEAVPLLELAEFPWRMLGPAILCASLVGGYGLAVINEQLAIRNKPFTRLSSWLWSLLTPCLLLLVIGLNAYYLYPAQFIRWGTPGPADAFAYEVSSGAIGTTSTGEFLPRDARQHPQAETLWPDYAAGRPPQKLDPASLPPGATVRTLSHRAESDTLEIDTPHEFAATLRTLYWPGWQVYLDGRPLPIRVTEPTGLIQVTIPPGRHTLALQLETTPLRTAGLWITVLSIGVVLAISGIALIKLIVRPESVVRRAWSVSHNYPPSSETSILHPPSSILHASRPSSTLPFPFFLLTAAMLIAVYLLSRPLEPLFTLQSNPDRPQPADRLVTVDFGLAEPLVRLVGLDEVPEVVQEDGTGLAELTATVYWRALKPLPANYAVFLHLDTPDGRTVATVDEAHPEDIPTRNWPPGLYLRNPLRLDIPAGLPPIRYDLTVGLYDPKSDQRLTVLDPATSTAYRLGQVWLAGPEPRLAGGLPAARFGPDITLKQATLLKDDTLLLYWQTAHPLDRDYSIFVHMLDSGGNLLDQADGLPYGGLYPPRNWRPGQIIEDRRPLTLPAEARAKLAAIAVGVYDSGTDERLPATDAQEKGLAENRYLLAVK